MAEPESSASGSSGSECFTWIAAFALVADLEPGAGKNLRGAWYVGSTNVGVWSFFLARPKGEWVALAGLGVLYACSSGGSSGAAPGSCETCSSHDDCPALSCPCANLPFNGTTRSCKGGCCVMTCEQLCGTIDAGSGGSGGSGGSAGTGDGGTAGVGTDAGPQTCPENGNVILATERQAEGSFGITVDADNVYWTRNTGTVTKMAKSDLTPVVILTDDISGAHDIVELGGTLYLSTSESMVWFPSTGGTPKKQTVLTLFNMPTSFGVDATDIYVGGNQGLGKIALDGNSIAWFLQGETCYAEGMVVDDDYIYWAGCDIWRIPKAGGSKELLAPAGHLVDGLAEDADNLYYVDPAPSSLDPVGKVLAVPKVGGAPVELASQLTQAAHPVVSNGEIYWATFSGADCSGAIQKTTTTGTHVVTTVVSGVSSVQAIAVDATSVYFTGQDSTVRMAPR